MIKSFNENRTKLVTPGKHIVVDEVMSAWKGLDSAYASEGLPHVTKIQRKPEGIGAEIKAVCDGETNIMLGLDLMEGKAAQQAKRYAGLGLGEGCAVMLRLCEPWFGTYRIVHADSAFSSVRTANELARNHLFFMGAVKTAHREFPKAYFLSLAEKNEQGVRMQRGEYRLMQSFTDPEGTPNARGNVQNGEMAAIYAMCWYDRKPQCVVSTCCGTTAQGNDAVRARHKKVVQDGNYVTQRYETRIPRPKLIETFFQCFSNIDVHDHYRQGSLKMEKSWKTHKWYHRIFATVFGICVVDAFYAHKRDATSGGFEALTFEKFIGKLSHFLVFNPYLEAGPILRDRPEAFADGSQVRACDPCALSSTNGFTDFH